MTQAVNLPLGLIKIYLQLVSNLEWPVNFLLKVAVLPTSNCSFFAFHQVRMRSNEGLLIKK